MSTTIKLRRDSAVNWTTSNPVLASGEPGVETDTGKFKLGDGVKTWSALAYSAALPSEIPSGGGSSGSSSGVINATASGSVAAGDPVTFSVNAGVLTASKVMGVAAVLTGENDVTGALTPQSGVPVSAVSKSGQVLSVVYNSAQMQYTAIHSELVAGVLTQVSEVSISVDDYNMMEPSCGLAYDSATDMFAFVWTTNAQSIKSIKLKIVNSAVTAGPANNLGFDGAVKYVGYNEVVGKVIFAYKDANGMNSYISYFSIDQDISAAISGISSAVSFMPYNNRVVIGKLPNGKLHVFSDVAGSYALRTVSYNSLDNTLTDTGSGTITITDSNIRDLTMGSWYSRPSAIAYAADGTCCMYTLNTGMDSTRNYIAFGTYTDTTITVGGAITAPAVGDGMGMYRSSVAVTLYGGKAYLSGGVENSNTLYRRTYDTAGEIANNDVIAAGSDKFKTLGVKHTVLASGRFFELVSAMRGDSMMMMGPFALALAAQIPGSNNAAQTAGVASATALDGQPVQVTIYGGIYTSATQLQPLTDYYVTGDGSLTTTATAVKVGKSLDSASLMVTKMF